MRIKIYFTRALLLLSTAVVMSGCTQENKQVKSSVTEKKSEQSAVNDSYQKKLIDGNLMSELDSVYSATNYKYINEKRDKTKPDSREFWYTIDELEGYIAFAKKEAESKGEKVTGLKIKLGQYPAKGPFDSRLDTKMYGYQTVYLIPTVISAKDDAQARSEDQNPAVKGAEIEGVPGMDLSSANPPY